MTLRSHAVLLAFLVLPVPAAAAPYTAPGNKVLWGGQGGYSAAHIRDFARQSGKHPLSTHPASRAALRRAVSWRRLTGVAP